MRPTATSRPTPDPARPSRRGFTLVEILAVLFLIAMLLAIAVTASQKVFRISREKRAAMTRNVLATAVYRYRHEYKTWPIPAATYQAGVYVYAFTNTLNQACLSMLRRDNTTDNPKQIQFLDESAILVEQAGQVISLAAAAANCPFVYRDANNNRKYFTVTINVDDETVSVQ
ncbi:MAG: type II secretion system protein [Lentisphaerae bacterium]|nr:type II secretion system protein [Lentisphaerota bacterium]